MAANVTYDAEAGAVMVRSTDGDFEGAEVRPGVTLHFDVAGRIVAIELLSASKNLAPGAFVQLQAERVS